MQRNHTPTVGNNYDTPKIDFKWSLLLFVILTKVI